MVTWIDDSYMRCPLCSRYYAPGDPCAHVALAYADHARNAFHRSGWFEIESGRVDKTFPDRQKEAVTGLLSLPRSAPELIRAAGSQRLAGLFSTLCGGRDAVCPDEIPKGTLTAAFGAYYAAIARRSPTHVKYERWRGLNPMYEVVTTVHWAEDPRQAAEWISAQFDGDLAIIEALVRGGQGLQPCRDAGRDEQQAPDKEEA